MERYQSTELANMRMEERDKCQKEFLGMKTEYELMYRLVICHILTVIVWSRKALKNHASKCALVLSCTYIGIFDLVENGGS